MSCSECGRENDCPGLTYLFKCPGLFKFKCKTCEPKSKASPIVVEYPLRTILDQRSEECEFCEWHPNVCEYCKIGVEEDLKDFNKTTRRILCLNVH